LVRWDAEDPTEVRRRLAGGWVIRIEQFGIYGVRREMKFSRGHAEGREVITVRHPDGQESGKLGVEDAQRETADETNPLPPQEVGVTAENQRNPMAAHPEDGPQMAGPLIAEEKHRVRPPRHEPAIEFRITQTAEMMRPGIGRRIRHKFRIIAGQ